MEVKINEREVFQTQIIIFQSFLLAKQSSNLLLTSLLIKTTQNIIHPLNQKDIQHCRSTGKHPLVGI